MFKKCKYCKKEFYGKRHFCSDACEIKNYTSSEVVILEKDIINIETKEEIVQESETF